eukprot:4097852-Heterocapsa_arctica.AAC.1
MSRSSLGGKCSANPLRHTSSSFTISKALTRSTRTAADSKPLAAATSSLNACFQTALCGERPFAAQL